MQIKLGRKRAQMMHLPFGFIFSIILIAVFLFVAFFAIKYFLDLQKCAQIEQFVDGLQNSVDDLWQPWEHGSDVFKAALPTSIEYVCFINYSVGSNVAGKAEEIYNEYRGYANKANLFFYPNKQSRECRQRFYFTIEHTTFNFEEKNPLCFENKKGSIEIKIVKESGEALVKVVPKEYEYYEGIIPKTCFNNKKDENEEGIDCGGPCKSCMSTRKVCENAQKDGLCKGLDIAYELGYKYACCREHEFCC